MSSSPGLLRSASASSLRKLPGYNKTPPREMMNAFAQRKQPASFKDHHVRGSRFGSWSRYLALVRNPLRLGLFVACFLLVLRGVLTFVDLSDSNHPRGSSTKGTKNVFDSKATADGRGNDESVFASAMKEKMNHIEQITRKLGVKDKGENWIEQDSFSGVSRVDERKENNDNEADIDDVVKEIERDDEIEENNRKTEDRELSTVALDHPNTMREIKAGNEKVEQEVEDDEGERVNKVESNEENDNEDDTASNVETTGTTKKSGNAEGEGDGSSEKDTENEKEIGIDNGAEEEDKEKEKIVDEEPKVKNEQTEEETGDGEEEEKEEGTGKEKETGKLDELQENEDLENEKSTGEDTEKVEDKVKEKIVDEKEEIKVKNDQLEDEAGDNEEEEKEEVIEKEKVTEKLEESNRGEDKESIEKDEDVEKKPEEENKVETEEDNGVGKKPKVENLIQQVTSTQNHNQTSKLRDGKNTKSSDENATNLAQKTEKKVVSKDEFPSKDEANSTQLNKADLEKKKVNQSPSPPPPFEPDMNFTLGPKVLDWDEQRAAFIKQHPGCNVSANGKPKTMLITSTDPKPCMNPQGDHLLLKFIKNKIDYARLHDLELYFMQGLLNKDFDIYWQKLPLLRTLMLQHPEIEWFWWMDSDAMFTDMKFEIPYERYSKSNMVIHGWKYLVYERKDWFGINAGIYLIRNNKLSLDLLDEFASYGPRGPTRNYWGPKFTNYMKNRPLFEGDDQATIVWVLNNHREKWGEKVYIEDKYNLHGFWVGIVDRYEQMVEEFKAGKRKDNWPFITHFVGCKICGKKPSYDTEKCIKSILRAFTFADNQILSRYGYVHPSLNDTNILPLPHQD